MHRCGSVVANGREGYAASSWSARLGNRCIQKPDTELRLGPG